ncbi:MAG: hypothetical protein QOF14_2003 [Hyphomicrobiales bacterium]|jgi:hypothetical protein|nr:hypothetical protein [Hyphomicrobiales bacterium]
MELVGATYLYTLATISITFVGFSTLFMIIRQTLGGAMSKFDVLLARNFLQLGFIAVVGSLLPPLLSLFSLHEPTIWRVASLFIAIFPLLFAVTYPTRRFAATGTRMPKLVWSAMFALYVSGGVLLLNAVGRPLAPGPGLFALGVSIIVFSSFQAFLNSLKFILSGVSGSPPSKSAAAPS